MPAAARSSLPETSDEPPNSEGAVSGCIPLVPLKHRHQFLAVARGRSRAMPAFVLQWRRQATDAQTIGFGLTASRKIGNAVVRNRARRRLRALAREILPHHGQAGTDYVLIARRETSRWPYPSMRGDLLAVLERTSRARS